ncbi:MAG TPA: AIR synthase related protein, partial [Spirochaetota bacterium]|nr:AIR synthase related protein [Spirochaetota bacterium]
MNSDKYSRRGVSSQKTDVHQAVKNTAPGVFPGAFCKAVQDPADKNKAVLMHADGAGTKSSLAYLYWRETGDLSVFKGIAQDALVMNTDDLLCAGVTDDFFLSNTIGRNKNRIPGEVIKAVIDGVSSFTQMLESYGIRAVSTGGETADVGDLVRTLIVDSTVYARLSKKDFINAAGIKPGQVIVALASFGKTDYENIYNAGIGSNGLTSARHELLQKKYARR